MPDSSGWTIDTLLEHMRALMESSEKREEQRFTASQKAIELGFSAQKSAVDAALAAADRAVIKAELAAEKRFESVNEFRATLSDQQRNLIPRSEVEVTVRGLSEKIATLQNQMERLQAERIGGRGAWGYMVGAAGLVVAVAALVLRLFSR